MKRFLLTAVTLAMLSGCSTPMLQQSALSKISVPDNGDYKYRIGTGDVVSVFVWRNAELGGDYVVSPDGRINIALSEPIMAAGKTTQELTEDVSASLSVYIKQPKVTIAIKQAVGSVSAQVRIVGAAATPVSIPYRYGMTLLDLMIQVGGLSRYASGNDAVVVRVVDNEPVEYEVRIDDLLDDADLTANVDLLPGDIVRIPEAWF